MKTDKAILRRINAWKTNPMLVSGVYKLFTYIPFEKIPAEYAGHFAEEARKIWDEDIRNFTVEQMHEMLNSEIILVLESLASGNVVNAVGFFPTVLADLWAFDYPVDKLTGKLNKEISDYTKLLKTNKPLADEVLMLSMFQMIHDIHKMLPDFKPTYDIEKTEEKIIEKFLEFTRVLEATGGIVTPSIDQAVDKALADYKEQNSEADNNVQDNSLAA